MKHIKKLDDKSNNTQKDQKSSQEASKKNRIKVVASSGGCVPID